MDTLDVHVPNGSSGDSLVLVALREEGSFLLFDAGDPSRLELREVLRLAHLFVSHCHVDHFVGFDALVRPRVCRPERITVHGPRGFLDRVESRLSGYTWNLVEGNHFVIEAREILQDEVRMASFDSGEEFRRRDGGSRPHGGVVHEEAAFSVESAALDHHVVSQGWAIQRPPRISVDDEALAESGLAPGAWLGELKRLAADAAPDDTPIGIPPGDARPLAELRRRLLRERPGERVAYVTDTACTEVTRPRIVALARDADVFACGAPFRDADAERARETRHLTARQAGELAAEAGARTLLLFHVSDRYQDDPGRHVEEALAGAGGTVHVELRTAR